MGWRYRKRVKIFPGFHINISKSGISANVGVKGASMTFGPKGTYVNTGLPGSGLYRRDKLYNNSRSSIGGHSYYYEANAISDVLDREVSSKDLFKVKDDKTIAIPSFRPLNYVWYFAALCMPIAGLALYIYADWWMFFSCVVVDLVQLICWSSVLNADSFYTDDSSCYRIVYISYDNDLINRKIWGHITRIALSTTLALFNFFPLFAMSEQFIMFCHNLFYPALGLPCFGSYSGGILVSLLMLFMIVLWTGCAIEEVALVKQFKKLKKEYYTKSDNNSKEHKQKEIQIGEQSGNEDSLAEGNVINNGVESIASNQDISPENSLLDDCNNEHSYEQGELEAYNPKLDLPGYLYPTVDLLEQYSFGCSLNIDSDNQNDMRCRLLGLLRSFGIRAQYIESTIGYRYTFYELMLAPGVGIKKVKSLEDDLALALYSHDVQILASIPGKGTIGIVVPNNSPSIVPLRSVLCAKQVQETTMDLPCAIGLSITNKAFMFDLVKAPHLLIGGATGQGKSMVINAIITSLLYKKHPSELKFVLMSRYGLELLPYNIIENNFLAIAPNCHGIVSDDRMAVRVLNCLCEEMNNRYILLRMAFAQNVKEYNAKFCNRQLNCDNGHRYMPYIVVIIDGIEAFIDDNIVNIERPLTILAEAASIVGIHLIILKSATIIQYTIKGRFMSR